MPVNNLDPSSLSELKLKINEMISLGRMIKVHLGELNKDNISANTTETNHTYSLALKLH